MLAWGIVDTPLSPKKHVIQKCYWRIPHMPLTDKAIRNLTVTQKAYKKYDAKGLYLEVKPTGSKLWRFRFEFEGKSKLLALGEFPAVGLKDARDLRDVARNKLARGIDPALEKQLVKKGQVQAEIEAANTFEKVAREWWEATKGTWSSNYATTIWRRIEANLIPWIGKLPITEIEPPLLLAQIRRIEQREAYEAAHRVAQLSGCIFRYAVAAGKAARDPAADIRDALKKVPTRNLPAITEPEDIRKLLLAMDGYGGSFIVYCALQMSALTFLRPGELRNGTWEEIGTDERIWKIPAARMKMRKDHLVPLADQAWKILEDLRPLTEGTPGNFIFPSERMNGRPMSENTINTALRTLGYPKDVMCAHGFRTLASTRLHESGKWDSRVIEVQLAHVDKNTIRGIYNRALYLDERRKMMTWWADYLDELREKGNGKSPIS
jgi:integrase